MVRPVQDPNYRNTILTQAEKFEVVEFEIAKFDKLVRTVNERISDIAAERFQLTDVKSNLALASLVRKNILPNIKDIRTVSMLSKAQAAEITSELRREAAFLKALETTKSVRFFERLKGLFTGYGFNTKAEWVDNTAKNLEYNMNRPLREGREYQQIEYITSILGAFDHLSANDKNDTYGHSMDLLAEMFINSDKPIVTEGRGNFNGFFNLTYHQISPSQLVKMLDSLDKDPKFTAEKRKEFLSFASGHFINKFEPSMAKNLIKNPYLNTQFKVLINKLFEKENQEIDDFYTYKLKDGEFDIRMLDDALTPENREKLDQFLLQKNNAFAVADGEKLRQHRQNRVEAERRATATSAAAAAADKGKI